MSTSKSTLPRCSVIYFALKFSPGLKKQSAKKFDEPCCICLGEKGSAIEGALGCKHIFCHPCIVGWAAISNYCPLCKVPFNAIKKLVRGIEVDYDCVRTKRIEEELLPTIIENTAENCVVCTRNDNSDCLLVCDHCNYNICHIQCMNPPLEYIPEEDWYCGDCQEAHGLMNRFAEPVFVNFDEFQIDEIFVENGRSRGGRRR
jgi:hypothetical protein